MAISPNAPAAFIHAPYKSGPSKAWLKVKNPNALARRPLFAWGKTSMKSFYGFTKPYNFARALPFLSAAVLLSLIIIAMGGTAVAGSLSWGTYRFYYFVCLEVLALMAVALSFLPPIGHLSNCVVREARYYPLHQKRRERAFIARGCCFCYRRIFDSGSKGCHNYWSRYV